MIEDAWKNFELSGKISDYLDYRQSVQAACGKEEGRREKTEGAVEFSSRGMDGYGTERGSDRDGAKCYADWRV